MMHTDFTSNWNGKLILNSFGTVRLHNPSKYTFGSTHEIFWKTKSIGTAKIFAIRTFPFSAISDVLSFTDTNMPLLKFKGMLVRMYSKRIEGGVLDTTKFDHIIFNWVARNRYEQENMISSFWDDVLAAMPTLFNAQSPT